jgi:hypothetical protein
MTVTPPILTKSVSFNFNQSSSSLNATSSSDSTTVTPSNKRRSLIKLGTELPIRDVTTYQHSDPLLRRLRLKNNKLIPINLAETFNKNIKIVLFLFG